VSLACWTAPIIDQVAGSGNLIGVGRAAAGGNFPTVGFGIAWHDLVRATSVPPMWLHPFTGIVKRDSAPGGLAVVTSVLVLAALVATTTWAWATRSRRLAAVGTTALVACAGTFLAAAHTPGAYHYQDLIYGRRIWWPVGLFVWIVLGGAAGTLLAARFPRWWRRAELPAVVTALAGIAVALVVTWPRLGPAQDYGSAGFDAARTLGPAVAASLRGPGPWVIRPQGDLALTIVGPGLVSQLLYRGRSVLIDDSYFPDFASATSPGDRRRPSGTILVLSAKDAGQAKEGFRLVARWDPASSPEPYRSYRQTAFLIPIEPVAVYLSTPA
jgi:hypothetical protein